MPFSNPKARAAYFEHLKQSGKSPIPSGLASGIGGSSGMNNNALSLSGMLPAPSMGKISIGIPNQIKPIMSLNNGLIPTPEPQTPNPLNIMKAKSPHLKNVKFPKLKKFL
jgi:hypothetical protein